MKRIDFIKEFFDTHFEYGPDFTPDDTPKIAWDRNADKLHTPFGFAVPEVVGDRWRLQYCSELIAEQTRTLSEGECDQYLHAVQLHLDQHVTHDELLEDMLERQIDTLIYSLSPALMELVNRVQLAAI